MINLTELRKVFADKLIKTDSFDEALTKALWTAYKQGIEDNKDGTESKYLSYFVNNAEWDEQRIDTIGQNGNEGLHYINDKGNENEN